MAELVSRGDIRILGGLGALNRDSSAVLTTQFATPGDLTLTAAQIYPETGAVVRVAAGVGGKRDGQPGFEAGSRLVIRRAADQLPDMPYSAFGTLRLAADIIEQGGALRAPLGLGDRRGEHQRHHLARDAAARQRHLRQRTRPDDALWRHRRRRRLSMAGAGRAPDRPGRREYHGSLSVGLQLAGQTVQVGDNALVDLSGGGQLLGAGFISAAAAPPTRASIRWCRPIRKAASPCPACPPIPSRAGAGRAAMAAPTAPDAGQSQPQIGQQVTIGAGVPGLPAGTYTLMPSTYALMPGAFRVEINGATPGLDAAGALRLRNGSWAIAGRLGNASAGIADAVPRQLLITSGQLLRQYSQYNEMDYAAFVAADAARRGQPRALAPADARTLRLLLAKDAPGESFSFAGRADFSAAQGGYSGTLAVASMNSWQDALEITAPAPAAAPDSTASRWTRPSSTAWARRA